MEENVNEAQQQVNEALVEVAQASSTLPVNRFKDQLRINRWRGVEVMEKPTKFVKPLTEEQRELLEEITKIHALPEQRMRTHAILLSDQHYSIDQIADLQRFRLQCSGRMSDW